MLPFPSIFRPLFWVEVPRDLLLHGRSLLGDTLPAKYRSPSTCVLKPACSEQTTAHLLTCGLAPARPVSRDRCRHRTNAHLFTSPPFARFHLPLKPQKQGLPRYSYTLVPANSLPSMVTSVGRRSSGMGAMAAGGRGTSANSRRWQGGPSPSRAAAGDGGGGGGNQQQFHADPHPHAYNHLHRHSRHATLATKQRQQQRPGGGRFRKESQDKVRCARMHE